MPTLSIWYMYLKICMFMSKVTKSSIFNQCILGCIMIAAILVGIQSYDSLENNDVVVAVDTLVLTVFTFEVVTKILAEGRQPWRYFTGSERSWNTFDFAIVLVCMPFIPLNSGSLAFLRLIRLLRVTKVFKHIPELHLIVMGMVQGLKSIFYIMLLLLLAFYLFSVLAVFLFRENDPGNFGNLPTTAITLFRCSTLEDWTDIMYINMLGCDVYDGGLYFPADSTQTFTTRIGTYYEFTCVSPKGQWALASLFFVFFTIISAFVVLSLFVGAITLAMSEVLEEQRKGAKRARIAAMVSPEWLYDIMHKALDDAMYDSNSFIQTPAALGTKNTKSRSRRQLLLNATSTRSLMERSQKSGDPLALYFHLSLFCRRVATSQKFEGLMLVTIIAAGILVGVSTMFDADDCSLCVADNTILGIFTTEIVIKLFAEGRTPQRYFSDPWNRFDFIIVIASYLPWMLGDGSVGSIISILRLLRILRVLKLVTKFKKLKIVVEALLKGFSSISYISLMMVVLFFMFAIIGMVLFKENDPWHFGLLQNAMLTLFRISTLEDWTDVMYINMWGCDRYGYGNWPELCTSPVAWGWLATFYFLIFAVIGSLVLVTLFLGVVTTSMEQAALKQKMEDNLKDQITNAQKSFSITDYGIRVLHNAFNLLDEDDGGVLEYDEIRPMLCAIADDFDDFNFHSIFRCVDDDRSGAIDFPEFIHLMILIKKWFEEHGIQRKRAGSSTLQFLKTKIRKASSHILGNKRRGAVCERPKVTQKYSKGEAFNFKMLKDKARRLSQTIYKNKMAVHPAPPNQRLDSLSKLHSSMNLLSGTNMHDSASDDSEKDHQKESAPAAGFQDGRPERNRSTTNSSHQSECSKSLTTFALPDVFERQRSLTPSTLSGQPERERSISSVALWSLVERDKSRNSSCTGYSEHKSVDGSDAVVTSNSQPLSLINPTPRILIIDSTASDSRFKLSQKEEAYIQNTNLNDSLAMGGDCEEPRPSLCSDLESLQIQKQDFMEQIYVLEKIFQHLQAHNKELQSYVINSEQAKQMPQLENVHEFDSPNQSDFQKSKLLTNPILLAKVDCSEKNDAHPICVIGQLKYVLKQLSSNPVHLYGNLEERKTEIEINTYEEIPACELNYTNLPIPRIKSRKRDGASDSSQQTVKY